MAETMTGWQTATLAKPITVPARASYVVSVNANGILTLLQRGFDTRFASDGLSTVSDGTGGLFGPPGVLSTQSFNNTNYFRDVVFLPKP